MHVDYLEPRLVFQSCTTHNEEFILYLERQNSEGLELRLSSHHAHVQARWKRNARCFEEMCAPFLSVHTSKFRQTVFVLFFSIEFYFWSDARSDAPWRLDDPATVTAAVSRRPFPIVDTAEETNVYFKWINSCYAALFIRFIFWLLILAYNLACHFLQLTEAQLNCPE